MNRLTSILIAPMLFLLFAANGYENPRLTLNGLGDIRIGMTVGELQSKFGAVLEYDMYPEVKANACAYWKLPKHPDLGLMIVDGKLARIEVHTKDYQSKSGAKIGMNEVEVKSIYGNWLEINYHPYSGKLGSYLELESSDGQYKMIFETGAPNGSGKKFASTPSNGPNPEKRVESFRAGLAGPVGYIEGCA